MGFTLKIPFHGTIGLVRDRAANTMHMLLPDFRDVSEPLRIASRLPQIRGLKHDESMIQPLLSYVRFDIANLDTRRTQRIPQQGTNVHPRFAHLRHFPLSGELLRLSFGSRPATPLDVDDRKADDDTPVAGLDDRSIVWLPELESLAPGAGAIDRRLLAQPPDGRVKLLARFDATTGHLQTTGVTEEKVRFESEKRKPQDIPIAREAELVLDVPDNTFTLESWRLDGSRDDGVNDMHFTAQEGSEVEVTIGNEPEADIYNPAPAIVPPSQSTALAALEFLLYYMMCESPVGDPAFPIIGGRRPGGTLCLQPRYGDINGG